MSDLFDLFNLLNCACSAMQLYTSMILPMLHKLNASVEMVTTQRANHAREVGNAVAERLDKFDALLCLSGDTTFHEFVCGIGLRRSPEQLAKLCANVSLGIFAGGESRLRTASR